MKISFKGFVAIITLITVIAVYGVFTACKAEQTTKNQTDRIEKLSSEVSLIADYQSTLEDGIKKLEELDNSETTSADTTKFVVITEVDEFTGVVKADTKVLAYPDEDSEELGELADDTKVIVDAMYENYYRISTEDKKVVNGWVNKAYFTKSKTEATATPKPTATAESTETPTISSFTYDETSGFTAKYKSNTTSFDGFEIKILDESGNQVCYKQTTPKTTSITLNSSDIKANTKYTVQVKTFKTENGTKKYSAYASKDLTTPKAEKNDK